jgi:hypothetical protein
MRLVSPGKILFFFLLFLPAKQTFTQATPQATESPNFVSAEISFREFAYRSWPWESKHPELATTVTTGSQLQGNKQVAREFRMNFPTLDIYSSAGVPLYFSDSSEVNVKVIDALPQVLPEPDLNPRYEVRPSLREALSAIPSIPRNDWDTPAQIDYTIVAFIGSRTEDNPLQSKDVNASQAKNKVTQQQYMAADGRPIQVIELPPNPHPDLEAARRRSLANQAQEQAMQRLKTRLNGSKIRVIEIHIVY